MITIFFRTLLIYLLLTGAMRLMGKRQIGELEVSELIITLLLSEIAALPIDNQEIPVLYAVIPSVTLLTLEVCTSAVLMKFPRLKRRVSSAPSMLICQGKLNQRELLKNRLSVDELFAGLRQQGVSDPEEVEYAIMEKNGSLSVILWEAYRPATAKDLSVAGKEAGLMHILISDGVPNRHNLTLLGRDEDWLRGELAERRLEMEKVLYFLCNDAGKIEIMEKEAGR